MLLSSGYKYPEILNPFKILELNPIDCKNIMNTKSAFKAKMKGNENPEIRLAYDMIVNSSNYQQIDNMLFKIKNKDIFYYAHVGDLIKIKELIEKNGDLLYLKDNLGRTVFYIASRNGYYSLCKYLLNKGVILEDSQNFGNTPLESALFYGHNSIVQLINEYKANQMYYLKNIAKKDYTIKDFDKIIIKDSKSSSNLIFFKFLNENHSRTTFINISIFDKEKYENIKQKFNLAYEKNLTKIEKSSIGAMIGMAIGDAMGARVEFQPLDYKYNDIKDMGHNIAGKFMLKPGQWTDDTSLCLCLADSLIENEGFFDGHDIMMRFMSWWFYGYNNTFRYDDNRPNKCSIGLGGNILGSFKKYYSEKGINEFTNYGNENTSGNGSIIRNVPISICYHKNLDLALKIAEKQSKITHKGNEASGCCQLLTFITVKILNGYNLKDVLLNLKDNFKCNYNSVNCLAYSQKDVNNPNENWNWKDTNYKYNFERAFSYPEYIGSYSMDTMAMALHILINTNSFEEAILKGVNLRGDADSLASVIGQIAGAYYGIDGIPKEWIQTILKWDKKREIALRGYILCHLYDNNNFS